MTSDGTPDSLLLPPAVRSFLDAVNARDAEAAGASFTDDARYHWAVPGTPAHGRQAIVATLSRLLGTTSKVRWDVVAAARDDNRVWLERVDNFWFGDRLAHIECNGIFELAPDGLIAEVRDYCDMSVWRERSSPAP
jgi:limonene-1,2-epoxide hydrolase